MSLHNKELLFVKKRCCSYKTVDSATAASQNGLCSYEFFLHEKTNDIQKMTKNIKKLLLLFYRRAVVKQDQYMTHILSYANNVLWCSRCKILRYVEALFTKNLSSWFEGCEPEESPAHTQVDKGFYCNLPHWRYNNCFSVYVCDSSQIFT